jgi:hypothetical protein
MNTRAAGFEGEGGEGEMDTYVKDAQTKDTDENNFAFEWQLGPNNDGNRDREKHEVRGDVESGGKDHVVVVCGALRCIFEFSEGPIWGDKE